MQFQKEYSGINGLNVFNIWPVLKFCICICESIMIELGDEMSEFFFKMYELNKI